MVQTGQEQPSTLQAAEWPTQVELIISALETGQYTRDRRQARRNPYRVRAKLRLFSDPPLSSPWTIYTRDVHSRGLGFISPHRLPLGYGGRIEMPGPEGGILTINCTLFRCRQAAPGWYEGSVCFNREQPECALPAGALE